MLAIVAGIGALLLIVAAAQRRSRPDEPRNPWLQRIGWSLLATPVVVLVAAFSYARLVADPDTLSLDVRSGMAERDLPGEELPGFPGFYDYTSDRVDIRLPSGRRLAVNVTKTTVTVSDGAVASITIRGAAQPADSAARVARDWARAGDFDDSGLDAAADTPERAWERSTGLDGAGSATVSLQPVGGDTDGTMIPRVRIELEATLDA